jgi:tetratricopeptide (TPR) repeat protein
MPSPKSKISFHVSAYRIHILIITLCFFTFFSCKEDTTSKNNVESKNLTALNEAIKNKPNDASLYFKRGQEYVKLKKDSIAVLDFKKACTLDSTKAQYFSAVGDLLFENKDITGSVSYIQKALLLNPNDVKAQLKVSKMFLFLKQHPKVFIGLNNVLRADVYNDEAYFLKGMTYKDLADTTNAINSFMTASKINPDNAEYYIQLALLHINKDVTKAKLYYENAFKTDTNNLEPINGIGVMHQARKENKLAKEAFIRCINADPDYAKAYYNLGCVLMDEDSLDKAIKQFNFAMQYNPTYTEAYYNRGLCHEIKNDMKAAASDYNQALAFDPGFDLALQSLKRIGK